MSEDIEIQKQPAKAKTDKVKAVLLKQLTKSGIAYDPGAEIEVTQAQADWLKALGVI